MHRSGAGSLGMRRGSGTICPGSIVRCIWAREGITAGKAIAIIGIWTHGPALWTGTFLLHARLGSLANSIEGEGSAGWEAAPLKITLPLRTTNTCRVSMPRVAGDS